MRLSLALLISFSASVSLEAQSVSRPLAINTVYNITSTRDVQDNRSITRQCNVHTYNASGNGSWSVQMEFSDNSAQGPWTSFGLTSLVTNTQNPTVGIGYGYHPWIRFNTTVGATNITYDCEKDFYIPAGSAAASCPGCFSGGPFLGMASQSGNTPDLGISRISPDALSLGNGTQGDSSASVTAGSFVGDGTNLTYSAGYPNSVIVNLGKLATDASIHATTCGVSPQLADNLSALQCALANAVTLGTGQVTLPAGTYNISNTLDIPNKVRLLGVGRGDPGSLGSGGMNTVIQANATFPSNGAPVVRIGANITSDAHVGSGVESLTIACNAKATVGLQELNAQQQTRNRHLAILGCSGYGYQIMGSANPGTGATNNAGPDEDIEIIPGATAVAATVDLDIENGQDLRPMSGISLVNKGATTNPTYCAKLSGNNLSIRTLYMAFCGSNGGAGVLVGENNTTGMQGLNVDNADLAIGGAGPVFEVVNNVTPAKGILLTGTRGGSYAVKNDITGEQSNAYFYAIGNGNSGNLPTLSLGDGETWNNFNFFHQNNQEQILTSVCPQLEIKNATGGQPGFPFCVDGSGNINLGMSGLHSAGNILFSNPFKVLSLSATGVTNGLTLEGGAADAGNTITEMIGDDLYWSHSPAQYVVTGNGSNTVNAIRMINGGGIDFLSASGVTENTSYNESQVSGWRRMLIGGSGVDIPIQNTPPAPATGFLRFYARGTSLCSLTSISGEACYGTGGGGGGGSILSNITAAAATNTINNDNFPQRWNWDLSTNGTSGFLIGESLASSASSSNLLNVNTLSGSSANPVSFTAGGTANGVVMDTVGNLKAVGTGKITATTTTLSVNTSAPLAGGGAFTGNLSLTCPSCVFSNSGSLPVNALVIGAGTFSVSPVPVDNTTTHPLFAGAGAPGFRAIATGDLPVATVFNNQPNTYTTGLQDMAAATLKIPIASGAVPTIAGLLQYDSTTNNLFFGNGSQTNKAGWFTGSLPTSGDCVKWGSNGQLQDFGGVCGGSGASVALSNILAAAATNTINNANFPQIWQWGLTTNSTSGINFTESVASTATTSNLVNINTLSTSTLKPIQITAGGTSNGVQMSTAGVLSGIGTGGITANSTSLTVSTTGPLTGGAALTGNLTLGCATCVASASSLTNNAVVVGGGSQASATIAPDSTTTHALFATGTAPAFRAMVAGDLPAATVFTNQASTYSSGLQDFNAVTLKLPIAAGAVPTTAGLVQYDSTSNNLFFGNGSQTNKTGWFTGTAPTSGDCVKWGANGQLQDFGSVCGGSGSSTALSNLTAAVATNTISNLNNPQVWQWRLTTNSSNGFNLTESTASTATTSSLLNVSTLATSTINPMTVTAGGTANGIQMSTTGILTPIGAGGITANSTSLNVNTSSPLGGGGAFTGNLTLTCGTCVTAASSLTSNAVVIGAGSQGSGTIAADTNTAHVLFATGTSPAFRSITASDLPSAAVYNNQANTYSGTGLQDFSAMSLKVPIGSSAAPTAAGLVAFNSTSNDLVFGNGSQTDLMTWFTGSPPISGNCVKWGANGQLQDQGATCGTGGSGTISINGVVGATFFLPLAVSGNGNAVVQVGTGSGATIQNNRTDISRTVTTGTDTMTGTDCGNTIYVKTAGTVAEAFPQPTLGGTYLGCPVTVDVKDAGGLVTITPSSATIDGASTLVMNPTISGLRKCLIKAVDTTHWRTNCFDDSQGAAAGSAPSTAGSSCGTIGAQTGSNTNGTIVAGAVTSCTLVLTFATPAPNGWNCWLSDRTTPADPVRQSSSTVNSCSTSSSTIVAGDTLQFTAFAY